MIIYILTIFNTIVSLMYIVALIKIYKTKKKLNTELINELFNLKKIDKDFWEDFDINDIFTDK